MRERNFLILIGLGVSSMMWADRPVGRLVGSLPAWLADAVAAVSLLLAIAAGLFIVAIALRDGAVRRARLGQGALLVVGSAAASLASAWLLKHLMGRARPEAGVDPWSFAPLAFDDSYASLPSAQASCAAAIALSLAIALPRLRGLLVLLGAAVCLARVLVGAHWPSDVMAGWALGAAAVAGVSRLMERFARKPDAARPGSH